MKYSLIKKNKKKIKNVLMQLEVFQHWSVIKKLYTYKNNKDQ